MPAVRLSTPIGDDAKVCVHVKDADGEPINLAAFDEITFILKRSEGDLDVAAIFKGTLTGGAITILDPSSDGVCDVVVQNTSVLMIGQPYYYKVILTDGLGKNSTPVYGTFFGESPVLH